MRRSTDETKGLGAQAKFQSDTAPGEKRSVGDEHPVEDEHRGAIASAGSPGDRVVELSGAALGALVAYALSSRG